MLDDEYLDAEVENAISIMQLAIENALDNNDADGMYKEIQRGHRLLMIAAKNAENHILGNETTWVSTH